MQKESIKFENSTIFEGFVSIRAILKGRELGVNDRKIVNILYDSERYKKIYKEIGYLKAVQKQYGYSLTETNSEELDKLTLGSSHGGIIAICESRIIPKIDDNFNPCNNGFYVMIQGIEDPYNFGYSLRSLYACGATGIILPPRNWMSAAGVVCRSSAGASEMFELHTSTPEEVIGIFKSHGYSIICADEDTEDVLGECALPLPILLIVGGEKRGISRSVLNACDKKVKISYGREFRASLSAASATTMFAYEIMRQNNVKKET